jgi:hypothetical protein
MFISILELLDLKHPHTRVKLNEQTEQYIYEHLQQCSVCDPSKKYFSLPSLVVYLFP